MRIVRVSPIIDKIEPIKVIMLRAVALALLMEVEAELLEDASCVCGKQHRSRVLWEKACEIRGGREKAES